MKITSFKSRQVSDEPSIRVVPYYGGHILIYLGCVIVVLMITWLSFKAYHIYTSYQAVSQHLQNLEGFVSEGQAASLESDPTLLAESMRGAATGLETLYQETQPFLPLIPYLDWIPTY